MLGKRSDALSPEPVRAAKLGPGFQLGNTVRADGWDGLLQLELGQLDPLSA